MKLQNFIRNTILIILTIYFFLQISRNCSHYGIIEWIIVLCVLVGIYAAVICVFKALGNGTPRKKKQPKTEPPTVQAPEEPQKVEGVMYTETEHGISRADGKGFTDEEVPYLMQRSYERALSKKGLYNGQMLDLSFIEKMDKNKKEYTTLPSYDELQNVDPCDIMISSTDIFFLKCIDGQMLEEVSIPQYWYYEYNLNYPFEIKRLISANLLKINNVSVYNLKVEELKNVLRHFKLPISGKKADLQKRVLENVSNIDFLNFFEHKRHYFCATDKGKSYIGGITESASKNLELEDTCIDLIMQCNFADAFDLISKFKHSVPAGVTFHNHYDITEYENIMNNNHFSYTLQKNRNIELELRAAVVFCHMCGHSQHDMWKLFERIYHKHGIVFDEDSRNTLYGRLL